MTGEATAVLAAFGALGASIDPNPYPSSGLQPNGRFDTVTGKRWPGGIGPAERAYLKAQPVIALLKAKKVKLA